MLRRSDALASVAVTRVGSGAMKISFYCRLAFAAQQTEKPSENRRRLLGTMNFQTASKLDFIHSRRVTDSVYQAVKQGTRYFYHVVLRLGG